MYKTLLSIVFILFLSSCELPLSVVKPDIVSQTDCCETFSEINFYPIILDKEKTIHIGDNLPIYHFDKGKSYFSAYQLPNVGSARVLHFKTFVFGYNLRQSKVFMPHFDFLNKDKLPILNFSKFRLREGGQYYSDYHFYGHTKVPSNASYLIIFTDDSLSPPLFARTPSNKVWPVSEAPVGKMEIKLKFSDGGVMI